MAGKWRDFSRARNASCLMFSVQWNPKGIRYPSERGRMWCPHVKCCNLKRVTRSYDARLGITYCHSCEIAMDALSLLSYHMSCSLSEAYDILDREGLLRVDTADVIA